MKGTYYSIKNDGFYGVYYPCDKKTDSCIIAMLGDSSDDLLAKVGVKYLHKLNCNVMAMSPGKKDYSHHDLPIERYFKACDVLKSQGNKKIGIMGASTTGMSALAIASYIKDITLTIAFSPSDFIMEGFYQENGIERPGNNESSLSFEGKPLPYLPFCYRHPQYQEKLKEEAKKGHNMVASREMFDLSEKLHPVKEEERIKVENIGGTIVFIGAEDDCLWDTCKYIRRMEKVLDEKGRANYLSLTYKYGTHFVFPESMLKSALPIGSSLFVKLAFKSAREHPKECKKARLDIDEKLKKIILNWI